MTVTNDERWRPEDADDRWHETEHPGPLRIEVQNRWLYGDHDPRVRPTNGKPRIPFSRPAHVVDSNVLQAPNGVPLDSVVKHVQRALELLGDDKRIVIEVRLADDQEGEAS